jgi:hypothetical protein
MGESISGTRDMPHSLRKNWPALASTTNAWIRLRPVKIPVIGIIFLISWVPMLSLFSIILQYFSCCWLDPNRLP